MTDQLAYNYKSLEKRHRELQKKHDALKRNYQTIAAKHSNTILPQYVLYKIAEYFNTFRMVLKYTHALHLQTSNIKLHCKVTIDYIEDIAFYAHAQDIYLRNTEDDDTILEKIVDTYTHIKSLELTYKTIYTDAQLSTLSRCRQLEILNVANFSHLTDATLQQIATHANLHTVLLGDYSAITDVGIRQLVTHSNNLHTISLGANSKCTNYGIQSIAQSAIPLQTIDVGNKSSMTDSGFISLIQSKSLTSMTLGSNSSITDAGIQCMSTNADLCATLREINFGISSRVSNDELDRFFKNCKNIERIDLGAFSLVNKSIVHTIAASCPKVTELNRFVFDNVGIENIVRNCPNIQHIEMEMHSVCTDDSLFAISRHCGNLEKLRIKGIFTDAGVASLCLCKSLSDIAIIVHNNTHISRNVIEALRQNTIGNKKRTVYMY